MPRRRALGQAFRERVLGRTARFRGNKAAIQTFPAANQSARSSLALAGLQEFEGGALNHRSAIQNAQQTIRAQHRTSDKPSNQQIIQRAVRTKDSACRSFCIRSNRLRDRTARAPSEDSEASPSGSSAVRHDRTRGSAIVSPPTDPRHISGNL